MSDSLVKDDAISKVALHDLGRRIKEGIEKDDWTDVNYAVKQIQDGAFEGYKLKDVIEDYIERSHSFTFGNLCFTLCLKSRAERNNASKVLERLADKGDLMPPAHRGGVWRKAGEEVELMNWKEADTTGMKLRFPLELEKMVKIFPKNIIIVAGYKSAGKSTFLMNFTKLNMNQYDIYYFNSEMGEEEMKYRLDLFRDVKTDEWKFYPFLISANFEEYIRPDDINIIDFLEIDDFANVDKQIARIFHALNKGIALIALQKNYDTDVARGGGLTKDKSRLYLSINPGIIKVVDAKNWATHENPNKKVLDFKLIGGSQFVGQGVWHEQGSDRFDRNFGGVT